MNPREIDKDLTRSDEVKGVRKCFEEVFVEAEWGGREGTSQ